MAKNNKMPAIRFSGYTDAWEQRKFKDIAFKRGKISEADLPYVEFEDINSGIGTLNKNILQKVGHKKGIVFEAGDVLFGKLRPYLQNWLLCQFMGIAVGDFWVFQPQIVSSAFLYYLIQSEAYQSVANISSGTKMPRSSWSLVSETRFSIPKYKEATMIGEFLTSIDKNITLHQRKLEKLKLTKKALLQKLFPKNGSNIPELRFKGFTNAWEQRKLSEIVTINPKTELPDEFKYVDLESVVGTNLLGFQVIKKENAPSRAQRLASYGDVFYQTVRPYQRNNYLFENVDKDMVFSTGYAQLRSKLDSYFLLTLVQNDNFVKVVLDNCTGTSYPAINGSELGKITVQIPPNEIEANQIGKVFRGIDKSITLHQRKLEMLKNVKKGLLQKMFV